MYLPTLFSNSPSKVLFLISAQFSRLRQAVGGSGDSAADTAHHGNDTSAVDVGGSTMEDGDVLRSYIPSMCSYKFIK